MYIILLASYSFLLKVNEKRVLLFSEVKRIAEELKQRYTNDTALGVISHDSVLLMAQETEAQVEVCFNSYSFFLKVNDSVKAFWCCISLVTEETSSSCMLFHIPVSCQHLKLPSLIWK